MPLIPKPFIRSQVGHRGHNLIVGERTYDLDDFRHVLLIGAGKATALMAKALEELLGEIISLRSSPGKVLITGVKTTRRA